MKWVIVALFVSFCVFIISCNSDSCVRFDLIEFNKDTIAFYKGEKFTGVACEYDSNQNLVGEYFIKHGKLFFQNLFYATDSSWTQSEIKNGLLHGKSVSKWKDGSVTTVDYLKGYPNGNAITYNKKGELELVKRFKGGEVTGLYEMYYKGKLSQKGKLVNNTVDSIWAYWTDSLPNYVLFNNGEEVINISRYVFLKNLEDSTFTIKYLKQADTIRLEIQMDSIYIKSVKELKHR